MFRISYDILRIRKSSFFSSRSLSKCIRIGCASGFWGDTATSVPYLVHKGKLDFLVFDYLSEITMSLLAAAKQKSPDLGYTPDFVSFAMAPNLQAIKDRGIKVVSNAGGINPLSCASALKKVSQDMGLDFKISVVTGDDLMSQRETIDKLNVKEMQSGIPLPKRVNSMNAYLGAGPIAKALKNGADIVITGRCVDSALALGPLISSFDWSLDDWDKLAAGSLAGHLLECGAQSTGGIHTDWHLVPDWHKMGFPIAECYGDGTFNITKPDDTGGLVNFGTVAEQLLYEIGDPSNYLLPDVTCDFTGVKLSEVSKNVVNVEGAKGKKPSDMYKVSATYSDGYRTTAVCPVIGPNAVEKAKRTAESVIKRADTVFQYLGMDKFRRVHMEILGSEQNYGKNSKTGNDAREVVMWMAVHHDQKEAIALFSREIAAAATGAAPGLTTLVGGRPKASPILRLFSFLYPKRKVKINITSDGHEEEYVNPTPETEVELVSLGKKASKTDKPQKELLSGTCTYRLEELAFTRSGDKGDTANIGVIARDLSYVPYIEKQLTVEAVAKYFEHLFDDETKSECVKRFYLPAIGAFNFVLENSLGGGGVASLRSDPQGKALGQILCDFTLHNMPELDAIRKTHKESL